MKHGAKRPGYKIGKRWVSWRARGQGCKADRRRLEKSERRQAKRECRDDQG